MPYIESTPLGFGDACSAAKYAQYPPALDPDTTIESGAMVCSEPAEWRSALRVWER